MFVSSSRDFLYVGIQQVWSGLVQVVECVFFFKQKTAYEMRISDWSSDVGSSDVIAQVLALAFLPVAASAQQQLRSDPEIYEKDHFRKQCETADFGTGFISRLDINNDGIVDAVSNHSELDCDGKRGPDCNDDGCPYNFYLRAKEGGYFMIATARIYGYDFIKRFGNMVLDRKSTRLNSSQ